MDESDALIARAIELAEQRLKKRPGDFEDFRHWLRTNAPAVHGLMPVSGVQSAVLRAVDPQGWRSIRDQQLLLFIDQWSANREPDPPIRPLPPKRSGALLNELPSDAAAAAPALIKGKPTMQANRERVLAALRAADFDPLTLPALKKGKPCPAKAAARKRAGLTVAKFDHAWKGLTKDEEILRL